MSLKSELLSLLENTDEPLPKRLKIATDIFNTNELPAFNKESVLFNWFSKTCLKENSVDIWKTLHFCLTSSHMEDISSKDVKHEDLNNIIKTIIKCLKSKDDFKSDIVICALDILRNEIFQQYLKYNLKQYCKFVSEILIHTNDIDVVKEVINFEIYFNKKIFDKNKYANYFLSTTLYSLLQILIKFKETSMENDAVKLLKLVLTNIDNFTNHLEKLFQENSDDLVTHQVIDTLNDLYDNDIQVAIFGFKLIFLVLSLDKTNICRYQLFIVFLHIIGFKTKKLVNINLIRIEKNYDLDKSLEILAEILAIMTTENITTNETINNVTFSDFVKSLLISIIQIQIYPNLSTLKIIKNIIYIDPLIIEKKINEVFVFIILYKKSDNFELLFSDLMISIIKLYAKLNRINKFYNFILETVKKTLFSKVKFSKPKIKFDCKTKKKETNVNIAVKEILSENFLQYLHECIILQPNKVIITIMKNFTFHMKEINENFLTFTEDSKIVFIQITSELICNFLSAVRIAEHTTTDMYLDKFVIEMNILREELKKFGTYMLQVEHNHLLMFSFLNICYIWAELSVLISYYLSPKNLNFKGDLDHDNSLNNLTYLHGYLTAEQWSLVSQRIKNFGEQPCKYILQKLIIQKLRAMLIFEDNVDKSIESTIISNYASNLETNWDLILSERIISTFFINKLNTSQLINVAEYFINFFIKTNNFSIFKQRTILNSRDLMTSIFYTCLSNIANLFRIKRKNKDIEYTKPTCIKIFKSIDEESFIKKEIVDIEKIIENFGETFNLVNDLKINDASFNFFMEIIKFIPVTCFSLDVQVTFFFFLLSICSDLRTCKQQNKICLQKCEEYLIALVENMSSPNIFLYMRSDNLLKQIIESTNEYNTILSFALGKALSQNNSIPSFKSGISLLEKNISDEKYFKIIMKTLTSINSALVNSTIVEENKITLQIYKEKLIKKLLKYMTDNELYNVCGYTILLEYYLANPCEETNQKLVSSLSHYIDDMVNKINEKNSENYLNLFKLIISKIEDIGSIPKNFNTLAWRICRNIKNIDKYNHFNEIITYLFQNDSKIQVLEMVADLLQDGKSYLKNHQTEEIINQLKMWKKFINVKFNDDNVIQIMHALFQNIVMYFANFYYEPEFIDEVIDFELNIIKNEKILQSSTMIDIYFQTIQITISKSQSFDKFITAFEISFPILETLFMYRQELLIDRLPTYLLHFRLFLHQLCINSNSDLNLNEDQISKLTSCAFRIKKLTTNICLMKKDFKRIVTYLIADFLKEYERIAFYQDVKYHLDYSLYELIKQCDEHAINYLLRVLSEASRELFKQFHHNYTTYYQFKGIV